MNEVTCEQEVKLYWLCAKGLKESVRTVADVKTINEHLDEIETLGLFADSSLVKARCASLLTSHRRTPADAPCALLV